MHSAREETTVLQSIIEENYLSGDPCLQSGRLSEWENATVHEFRNNTFLLADCEQECRTAVLGLAMKSSLENDAFDLESIKYMFIASQRRADVPITERNTFLRENLNEKQKEIFLDYCAVAKDRSEGGERHYWENLLGLDLGAGN